MKTGRAVLPQVTGLLLAALLLAASAAGILIGHAELELQFAKSRLDGWWQDRTRVELLDQAANQLARADFALQRAELHARRGELGLIRFVLNPANRALLIEAEAHISRAIAERPLWPQYYGQRAVIRARLGESETVRADLRRALELGPNTLATLALLAAHAGAIGPRLDAPLIEALLAMAERYGRYRANTAVALVKRFGWLAGWCARPEVRSYELRACARLESDS